MKRWLCIIWCFLAAPLSFFLCWCYDWYLGSAVTSYLGVVSGSFLLLASILLLLKRLNPAKMLVFIGCGINLAACILICVLVPFVYLVFYLIAVGCFLLVTLVPIILLFNAGASAKLK